MSLHGGESIQRKETNENSANGPAENCITLAQEQGRSHTAKINDDSSHPKDSQLQRKG
jgi:hypothetical protein